MDDGMRMSFRVDAVFPDRWAESEVRADVIGSVTNALFEREAFQVTFTQLEE